MAKVVTSLTLLILVECIVSTNCFRVNCYVEVAEGSNPMFLAKLEDLVNLCSHLTFTYAPTNSTPDNLEAIVNRVKKINTTTETLIAVNGLKLISLSSSELAKVTDSIASLARDLEINGVVLDWRFQGGMETYQAMSDKYNLFIDLLREPLSNHNQSLVILLDPKEAFLKFYNLTKLNQTADWIEFLSFDYIWSNQGIALHNSPLHKNDPRDVCAVANTIKFWSKEFQNSNFLSMGLLFKVSTQKFEDSSNRGPYAKVKSILGAQSYRMNCEMLSQETSVTIKNWEAPYIIKNDLWMTFEDAKSLRKKVFYAKQIRLGGVMIHFVTDDDYSGECNSGIPFPLTYAVYNAVVTNSTDENANENSRDESSRIDPLIWVIIGVLLLFVVQGIAIAILCRRRNQRQLSSLKRRAISHTYGETDLPKELQDLQRQNSNDSSHDYYEVPDVTLEVYDDVDLNENVVSCIE